MLGNFGVLSFSRSWKLTRFLTTFRIWTFSAFLYISETTRTNFFKISSHNLHNVYNNVWNFHWDWFTATPWNFKTILSYDSVKNPRYSFHCFDVMLIFPNLCGQCLDPWLVHFSVSIVNVLHSKDAINSN